MKKSLISKLLILGLAAFVLAGCGNKTAETADAVGPVSDDDEDEASLDEADSAATEAYMNFLANKEPVYFTWYFDSDNCDINNWVYSDYVDYFNADSAYVFSDFMKEICTAVNEAYEINEYPRGISYSIIDAGADGEPELLIKVDDIAESSIDMTDLWGIRLIDDKLQVIFYEQYGYRTGFEINEKGYISSYGSSGAASYSQDYYFVDSEGNYKFDCGCESVYGIWALYIPDSEADFEALAEEQGISDSIEIDQYCFRQCGEDEDYASYQKDCKWIYYEVSENGERRENDDIYEDGNGYKNFWDETGLPLNTDEEINDAIEEKHKQLGITDEILNAEPAEWTELTEEMLDEIYEWAPEVVTAKVLPEPSWEYYCADANPGKCTAVELSEPTWEATVSGDEALFARAQSDDSDGLSFDDLNYHYELYGEDEDGLIWYPYMMDISSKETGELLYTLDFSSYYKPPVIEEGSEKYVEEYIGWAVSQDDILYVSTYHNTYASSAPQTGYITALDMNNDFEIIWRSEPLVCNSENFVVTDDALICGYGFTKEDDYVYVLDLKSGVKVGECKLKSAPEWISLIDNTLYVSCYDTDCTFDVKGL